MPTTAIFALNNFYILDRPLPLMILNNIRFQSLDIQFYILDNMNLVVNIPASSKDN